MRQTGPASGLAVVCVNGGQGRDVRGNWSATLEWLVARLAPAFPGLGFAEVRYRIRSWNRLGMCVEDTLAALDAVAPRRALLLGFSMGGAVAIGAAGHPAVRTVLGLAPVDPGPARPRRPRGPAPRRPARRVGPLPAGRAGRQPVELTPRVRAGPRRAASRASYELIARAVHPIAVRAPWGASVPLPRAGRWASLVAAELERFQASEG